MPLKAQEFDSALDELEAHFERLRALYEDFFAGAVAVEPSEPRRDMDRRFAKLLGQGAPNGPAGTKLHSLLARYESFQQYWQRMGTRIEARTRVKRFASARLHSITLPGAGPAQHGDFGLEAKVSADWSALTPPLGTPSAARFSAARASGAALRQSQASDSTKTIPSLCVALPSDSAVTTPAFDPSAIRAALVARTDDLQAAFDDESETVPKLRSPITSVPPALEAPDLGSGSAGFSRERIVELHAKLCALSSGSGRPVSLIRLAKALEDTEAKLKAEHGDRTITFDVVVKNGKALVKPVVR